MTEKKPFKILVVRFSSIGDIVLTTPVVRCLKTQLNAEVHYLTKSAYRSILAANPYIDKIWCIEKEVTEVQFLLKKEKFTHLIDLHKNLRTLRLKLFLGVKAYSFDKLNIEKWLLVRFKINRLPNVHIVERYLNTVQPLGVQNDGKGLDYFVPPADMVNLRALLQPLRPEINLSEMRLVAFAIGAAHGTKRLPNEKIAELCGLQTRGGKTLVLLLGGKTDAQNATQITQQTDRAVINLCGELNLNQSASVLQQVDAVLTHDTGLMHIAAAWQQQITAIWCSTVPEFGMYPYTDPKRVQHLEVKGLSCRPCSKIGYEVCPKGHFKCSEVFFKTE